MKRPYLHVQEIPDSRSTGPEISRIFGGRGGGPGIYITAFVKTSQLILILFQMNPMHKLASCFFKILSSICVTIDGVWIVLTTCIHHSELYSTVH
jgi:hypothetical protein